MPGRAAHLNLIDSSRQLFELDPDAEIETGAGWVFAAGRSSHPLISNAAFRVDDGLEPNELLHRAQAFFASRNRGFAIWARTEAVDGDLVDCAERAGLKAAYEMPEMVLSEKAEEGPPPDGAELRRVASPQDASQYWQVAISAYASLGFPPEVFAYYQNSDGLWADNVAAFLAHVDGRPAGIAMTIVSHGVAGIYWVGCTEDARGQGLGRRMTAAAVNAGLDMGAKTASLQASPMGEGLYRQMGFEAIFDYRLLASAPAEEKR
jgi:GNAT superfamily N-acetyltransferase